MTDTLSSTNKLIAEYLVKELEGFKEFKALLLSEQNALINGDTSVLSDVTETKDQQAQKLNKLASGRSKLVTALGFTETRDGIAQWVNQTSEETSTLWSSLLGLAQEIQRINELNGKLIHTRLQYTQQSLSALLTAVNQANLYGSNGQPNAVPQSGNVRGIIGKA